MLKDHRPWSRSPRGGTRRRLLRPAAHLLLQQARSNHVHELCVARRAEHGRAGRVGPRVRRRDHSGGAARQAVRAHRERCERAALRGPPGPAGVRQARESEFGRVENELHVQNKHVLRHDARPTLAALLAFQGVRVK